MKGLVFTLPRSKKGKTKSDLLYYVKRYGKVGIFAFCLLLGMIIGALMARNADRDFLNGLDFIFVTNFESRAEQTIFMIFAASLTSYFLFFVSTLFIGLSTWGALGVPVLILFKGLGVGLSAGYLYQTYALQGFGFYLLIMLPGVLISSIALIVQGREAFDFSKSIWHMVLRSKKRRPEQEINFVQYLIANSYILIVVAIAALVDSLLSTFFSGVFHF